MTITTRKEHAELVVFLYQAAKIVCSPTFNENFRNGHSVRTGCERLIKLVYSDFENASTRLNPNQDHTQPMSFTEQAKGISALLLKAAIVLDALLPESVCPHAMKCDLTGDENVDQKKIESLLSYDKTSQIVELWHVVKLKLHHDIHLTQDLLYLDSLLDSIGTFVTANHTLRTFSDNPAVETIIEKHIALLPDAKTVHPYDLLIYLPKEAKAGETAWVCNLKDICIHAMSFWSQYHNREPDPTQYFVVSQIQPS